MPLRFFMRSSSQVQPQHIAKQLDTKICLRPEMGAICASNRGDSDATLSLDHESEDFKIAKKLEFARNFAFRDEMLSNTMYGLSSKTFSELPPIEEVGSPVASKPASPSSLPIQLSVEDCTDAHLPERCDSDMTAIESLSNHSSVEHIEATLSAISLNQADKSKKSRGLLARLLKKDVKGKDEKKSTVLEVVKETKKPVSEKLSPKQKEVKALAERKRRLEEVLSVLEGRKQMPEGMQDLKFANFIGDGTYGFVVTAFRGEVELAVKFIFKEKIPATAWMNDAELGSIPSEIYFLKNLKHLNMIKFHGCYENEQYIIMLTELHGISWDSANPILQQHRVEGLRSTPRAHRVGSEGKGDLNTLSSLSAAQRQMLRPRVSCDLFECIDAHEYFPERIVRHIFRQVVSVVAYLHSQGVVHRDLKDENIVIDENYNIKLIDFGSAAFIPSASGPLFDKFLGTMDFAAPEIIDGYRYRGPEVEIWALGVLLYILVFRQVPFKNSQDIATGYLHLPTELREYYADTDDLYDLLRWMLQHKDERPTISQVVNHRWLRSFSR